MTCRYDREKYRRLMRQLRSLRGAFEIASRDHDHAREAWARMAAHLHREEAAPFAVHDGGARGSDGWTMPTRDEVLDPHREAEAKARAALDEATASRDAAAERWSALNAFMSRAREELKRRGIREEELAA